MASTIYIIILHVLVAVAQWLAGHLDSGVRDSQNNFGPSVLIGRRTIAATSSEDHVIWLQFQDRF